jgi:hypothetical protein
MNTNPNELSEKGKYIVRDGGMEQHKAPTPECLDSVLTKTGWFLFVSIRGWQWLGAGLDGVR